MKLPRALILSAVVLAVAVFWFLHEPATESTPGPARPPAPLQASSADPPPAAPVPLSQGAPAPEAPAPSSSAPVRFSAPPSAPGPRGPAEPPPAAQAEADGIRSDLDRVRSMVRDYRSIVGENPVGTNAEIM